MRHVLTLTISLLFLSLLGLQPVGAQADIIINEVYYGGDGVGGVEGDWVEFKNIGDAPDTISSWFLCAVFNYGLIGTMTILSGDDYMLEPGEILVVEADLGIGSSRLSDGVSDLGLYSSGSFGTASAMDDFLQYGASSTHGRQTVARDAGLWRELEEGVYDFTSPAAANESTQYCGNGARTSRSDEFVNAVPSPGMENACSESDHVFSTGFEAGDTCHWTSSTEPSC